MYITCVVEASEAFTACVLLLSMSLLWQEAGCLAVLLFLTYFQVCAALAW